MTRQNRVLLAQPVAEEIYHDIEARVTAFKSKHRRPPRLAVVLVGQNPASVVYTRKKGETAVKLGLEHDSVVLPETASPEEVKRAVERLNENPAVDGILIQRPLPPSFKEEEVVYWVSPAKDVDAFHPENTGRLALGLPCFQPCTPSGIMELMRFYQIHPSGKIACVIGRSSIVGKPMAALLLQANATVLHGHSKTPNLPALAKQADILVAAIGKPGLIGPEHVKEGAVVIDVGINRGADGKLVGDVDYARVAPLTSAITPVPGGVGPMTIAILLRNTVRAAELRAEKR